jgi:hypothetical protein
LRVLRFGLLTDGGGGGVAGGVLHLDGEGAFGVDVEGFLDLAELLDDRNRAIMEEGKGEAGRGEGNRQGRVSRKTVNEEKKNLEEGRMVSAPREGEYGGTTYLVRNSQSVDELRSVDSAHILRVFRRVLGCMKDVGSAADDAVTGLVTGTCARWKTRRKGMQMKGSGKKERETDERTQTNRGSWSRRCTVQGSP